MSESCILVSLCVFGLWLSSWVFRVYRFRLAKHGKLDLDEPHGLAPYLHVAKKRR